MDFPLRTVLAILLNFSRFGLIVNIGKVDVKIYIFTKNGNFPSVKGNNEEKGRKLELNPCKGRNLCDYNVQSKGIDNTVAPD